MHLIPFLPFLAALIDASDATLYLRSGAINVGLVVLIVEGLIEGLAKPWVDAWLDPLNAKTASRHDATLQILVLVFTVLGVTAAQALGPIGIHDGSAVLALAIQAVLALLAEWGVYYKLRQGVPATPTPAYLRKVAEAHGSALAGYIAPDHFPQSNYVPTKSVSSSAISPSAVGSSRPATPRSKRPPSDPIS